MKGAARSLRGADSILVAGTLAFLLLSGTAPLCGMSTFVRGDADGNGSVNLSDAVEILKGLFVASSFTECPDAADTDDDGAFNLSDAVFLLNHLFAGGPAPPAPFPESGVDLSPDTLDLPEAACGVGPANPTLLRPGTSSVAISGNGRIVAHITTGKFLVENRVTREVLLDHDHRVETLTREEAGTFLDALEERGIHVDEETRLCLLVHSNVLLGVDHLHASLSSDGARVAYEVRNWIKAGDTVFQYSSVQVEDIPHGAAYLVSVSSSGDEADATCILPRISGDGRRIVFLSRATNLVHTGTSGGFQVYVHDLESRRTELVSLDHRGFASIPRAAESPPMRPDINFDGTRIVFATNAFGLDDLARNWRGYPAVYLRDLERESTTLLSGPLDGGPVDGASFAPRISDDGHWVVFLSAVSGVLQREDVAPGRYYTYLYDVRTGRAVDVLRDPATGNSGYPGDLSSDGTRIVFDVRCDLCVRRHVYLFDRGTGRTDVVSTNADGEPGHASSWNPVISQDGRFVAFSTDARNLLPRGESGSCLRFVPR